MPNPQHRSQPQCSVACCVGQPCRRSLIAGPVGYSGTEYRRFMRRIYTKSKRTGLLCENWADSLDAFIEGVEKSAGMPPSLRHRLVATGTTLDTLLILMPGNVAWWSNQGA